MKKHPNTRVVLALIVVGGFCPSLARAQDGRRQPEVGVLLKLKRPKVGLYELSRAYFALGTALDMSSTVKALNHPTVAVGADGTVLAYYHATERGWAGILSKRNASVVVLANVGLNFALDRLGQRLERHGGALGWAAIVVNVLKGTDNLIAGIHNVRHDAGVNAQVRRITGYGGLISWSR